MYWCVGRQESADHGENTTEQQEDTRDMGGRQSTTESFSVGQSSVTKAIQNLYQSRDFEAALQLVRSPSQRSLSQEEKGHLLSLSAAYGDLQAVRYLLKEAGVTVSLEPSDDNPAVVAAYFGHKDVAQELLDSFLGVTNVSQLLSWMLAVACQQGHLEVVKLLVLAYKADPDSYAVKKNEFPVLLRLPLYAAMQAGHDDVAAFLLENGSFFCSYTLMDCPNASKRLLCKHFIEPVPLSRNVQAKPGLSVNWSKLRLPWVDFDWLIDLSHQITELDLSANHLASLPSIIPWGLINLQKLNLSDNRLNQLLDVQSSDGIICTKHVALILREKYLGVILNRVYSELSKGCKARMLTSPVDSALCNLSPRALLNYFVP